MSGGNVSIHDWLRAWRGPKAGTVRLSLAAKAVAPVIAAYADPVTGRNARPAATTVASALTLRRETVGRAMQALARAGWFEVTARPTGKPVVYALRLPPG